MDTSGNSSDTEPYSLYVRGVDEAPTEAVVSAVAEVAGRPPLKMKPLGDVIDPDALNRQFGRGTDDPSSVTVTFDYCDQQVTVTADAVQVLETDSTNG